ncbi:MAG: DMT family transporter [Crocinitomix sp.]|nr:DMT family transporter [Crocinitomix sp.]
MEKKGNFTYYFILNLTVFVWGFTAILGDEIKLDANKIVFFRTAIAFVSLFILGFFIRKSKRLSFREILPLLGTGAIVGLHWFTFFHSIKISNVEIAVVCLSSATLFTAILEPIIFSRKFLSSEFVLSFAIIFGIALIIGFESKYISGILVGLSSAFCASLFNVLNGKYVKTVPTFEITKYEMLGGFVLMFVVLLATNNINRNLLDVTPQDWIYLSILGLICTTGAFLVCVWLMKFLSPFTVSMSLNMEPIYSILIVVILGWFRGIAPEQMSMGFYIGTVIILGSIFLNAYLKRKKTQL